MTAEHTTPVPASRRALISGAIGAAVAALVGALGRPASVRAASGYFDSAVNSTPALAAMNTAVSGSEGYGVYAESNSTNGTAVSGWAKAGSGYTTGVMGVASSTGGAGVAGLAGAASGSTYGLYGEVESTGGTGAVGFAAATAGATRGVFGRVNSFDGNAVIAFSGGEFDPDPTPHSGTAIFGQSNMANGSGVRGAATATSGAGVGVHGSTASPDGAGVSGESTALTGFSLGVFGSTASNGGSAVVGLSTASTGYTAGLDGTSNSPSGAGAWGWAINGGTGVMGISDDAYPDVSPKTGVFGVALGDAAGKGVYGKAVAGRGVYGQATTGQGVRGYATSGAAGYFATSGLKSGVALRTIGRVRMDNSAGIATILSGTNSIVVTPGIDLVATSAVTATLQGNPGGTAMVRSVAVNATNDTFTIYLTANATANVKVAWHVFG